MIHYPRMWVDMFLHQDDKAKQVDITANQQIYSSIVHVVVLLEHDEYCDKVKALQ
jgi:hypothetical protein